MYNFEGWFKDDKREGEGQLIEKGIGKNKKEYSQKYNGGFKEDLYHGNAVHVNTDGDIYEGDFSYGKREGMGNLKKMQEVGGEMLQVTYLGEFKNGKFSGKGLLKRGPEDQSLYTQHKFIHSGDFLNDKKDGQGEMYWNPIDISSLEKPGKEECSESEHRYDEA